MFGIVFNVILLSCYVNVVAIKYYVSSNKSHINTNLNARRMMTCEILSIHLEVLLQALQNQA